MTWVTWRQYRTELLIAMGILAAMMAFLVPTGLNKHAMFGDLGLGSCMDTSNQCLQLRGQLGRSYDTARNVVTWFNLLPALVGMLLAAPIITELEQGTHRLAWTQSVTRGRWLVAKLWIAFGGAALFAVALTVAMTWWYAPFDRIDLVSGSDLGRSFDSEGVMPFAHTVFALSLALGAGVLFRKMLIAMPVAFVGFVVLRVVVLEWHRQGVGGIDYEGIEGLATRDMEQFWTYQAIEGAIFLSLAAVLVGLTAWVVRRRP